MSIETARRAGRTRLTPEREHELYAAVLDLLREVGYEGLTMDAVATRTRSSKATLYRQWKGKPELVVAALKSDKPVQVQNIDTGSLAGDLHEIVRQTASKGEEDIAVMRGLFHAMDRDPVLAQAFRESLIQPEVAELQHLLDRAVARGELDPKCPARAFLPQMMFGALIARPIFENKVADKPYLRRYVDAVVLPALGVK